ncbi:MULTISPECIES: EcsC family protein [Pseudomonas chlororaphis group]|uniref:EcsC family protein n=1 Tax=Pseudomonas chlororaphis group TaxID=136842 RepID=UPI000F48350D|nr:MULTISPECIES: EcsC family protein [Pseudomonas chlororaphis group]MCO7578715.1 EcsC family protein [Pseudomonas protegens]MCO7585648.1 EcsC family protein [Pseudomonas chlororaphis]MCO7601717.1 EcsC family protein [Pseudomonas chlororaphis]ROL92196.1 peptidase [Pseudomonas protegens]ROM03517.1 peptidase [Pseudomonas protegens]
MNIKDNPQDYGDLKRAVGLLESPSLTARLSGVLGSPIESAVKALPNWVSGKINDAVVAALQTSADAALWSLENTPKKQASTLLHKVYAATSGAVGGAFGFAALFVELPISTTIMMRSVADVARSEGFDLNDLATKQACIEVFAMGGNSQADDATETGYYLTRSFTTQAMQQLSKELAAIAAKQGVGAAGRLSPGQVGKWLALLIEKVASRYGVTISSKFAAQAVPVIGALTGATINALFTDFYQDMARGHFIVRRLERKYGFEQIKGEYAQILGRRLAG